MNNIHNQASDGEAKAKPEVIKLGLDLHARQVTECRQLDGSTPKPAQKWALTQFWCSVYGLLNSGSGSRRARSNSIPARPYICRFSILSRFMCPSTGPLLHGVLTADSTA